MDGFSKKLKKTRSNKRFEIWYCTGILENEIITEKWYTATVLEAIFGKSGAE